MLAVHDGAVVARDRLAAVEHCAQRFRPSHNRLRMAGKQVEEPLLLGHQGVEPAKHRGLRISSMRKGHKPNFPDYTAQNHPSGPAVDTNSARKDSPPSKPGAPRGVLVRRR